MLRILLILTVLVPTLFSCSTLQNKTHTENENQPEQVEPIPSARATPVATDLGRLVKLVSTTDILFDFDSYRLKPESRKMLDYFAKELQFSQNEIQVTGYADRIGPESYNQKLSLRRAESVKIYFISKGIVPEQISVLGFGEKNPITGDTCKNSLEIKTLIECLSPDRRVEIDALR